MFSRLCRITCARFFGGASRSLIGKSSNSIKELVLCSQKVSKYNSYCTRPIYGSIHQCRCQSTSATDNSPKVIGTVENSSNSGLTLEFENGSIREFLYIWLRDSCRCALCFDKGLELKNMDSWVPDLDIKPSSSSITPEGHLSVRWPSDQNGGQDHESLYPSSWLWQCHLKISEGLKEGTHDDQPLPSITMWSGLKELPTVEYRQYIETDEGFRRWMELFHTYGFVILKGVPEDKTECVPAKISFIRETCFGRTSEVFVGPESGKHPGYTGVAINLHTDLTYMERSPGTLNLHCLRSADPETCGSDAGGQTMLADGIEAAYWLKDNAPEMFNLLTQVKLPYAYRMPTSDFLYRCSWPVVTLDPRGNVREIHFSNFARRILTLHPDLIAPVYQAIKSYANRLQKIKTSFFLHPGDLLSINNRRVLHARTQFDPQKATRHLRTYYMDLDEVYGRYHVIMNKEKI